MSGEAFMHLLDAAKQVIELTDAHVSLYSGDEVLTRLSAAICEVELRTRIEAVENWYEQHRYFRCACP